MKLATLVECFPRPIIDPSLSLLLSLSKTASGGVDGAFPLARLVAFGATKPEGGWTPIGRGRTGRKGGARLPELSYK